MKKIVGLLSGVVLLLLLTVWVIPSEAAVPLDQVKVNLGLQYRVMYNYSNIQSNDEYDFFNQRFRIALDVKVADNVGGYAQLQYGGDVWGDESPSLLQYLSASGVRYGYIYYTHDVHTLLVGILPASDQVGDTLFSADWNFNVGGIAFLGKAGEADYRLAYVRLADTYSSTSLAALNDDDSGHIFVVDVNTAAGNAKVGGHIYYTDIDAGTATTATGITQGWYAVTASAPAGPANLNGFVMFNDGKIGATDNDGYGLKLEATLPAGTAKVGIMGILTSGDTTPAQGFQTVEGLLGTEGYWAYTHIFTANGPSDVNDFGLEIGNGGYGLWTLQGKADFPISDIMGLQLAAGWFKSSEDIAITGGTSNDLGTELSGTLTVNMAKNLALQAGLAYASLGDAGMARFQDNLGATEDSVMEVFSRFQLEF